MSHTLNYTATSKFKVKDAAAFIAELERRNVFPHGGDRVSQIGAGYFFDKKDQTFVISGNFNGFIGEFDLETDEINQEYLTSFIMEHIDGSAVGGDLVSIITTFTEFRSSVVVNTGCTLDQIEDGVLQESCMSYYTNN